MRLYLNKFVFPSNCWPKVEFVSDVKTAHTFTSMYAMFQILKHAHSCVDLDMLCKMYHYLSLQGGFPWYGGTAPGF